MMLYVAGPMAGFANYNEDEFGRIARELRAGGHIVFNPAEQNRASPTGRHRTRRDFFATDCAWLCAHAQGIALMEGWADSSGARAEVAIAEALKIESKPWTQWTGAPSALTRDNAANRTAALLAACKRVVEDYECEFPAGALDWLKSEIARNEGPRS